MLQHQADVENAVSKLFQIDERNKALDDAVVNEALDSVTDDLLGEPYLFCNVRKCLARVLIQLGEDFAVF